MIESPEGYIERANREINDFINHPNAMQSFIILIIAIIVAYLLSNLVAKAIVKIGQMISVRAENEASESRIFRLRQVETYLSITVAAVRMFVVLIIAYFTWTILSPASSPSIAAIGASAIFVVIAGSTINPLLRDITAGATMIIEGWFRVGDYVMLDPFPELSGVVERITLRSTQIRTIKGEVVWVHNQFIQGARVTPRGLRTMAIDIFVNNQEKGRDLVNRVIEALPHNPLTIVNKMGIKSEEQWGEKLWVMTVIGQTPPGREWLMEEYFVDAINELDEEQKTQVLARKPLVRYADPAANRSFRRAVHYRQPQ